MIRLSAPVVGAVEKPGELFRGLRESHDAVIDGSLSTVGLGIRNLNMLILEAWIASGPGARHT